MKRLYTLLVLLVFSITCIGQVSPFSISPDWYFGKGCRFTFNSGSFPSATSNDVTGGVYLIHVHSFDGTKSYSFKIVH